MSPFFDELEEQLRSAARVRAGGEDPPPAPRRGRAWLHAGLGAVPVAGGGSGRAGRGRRSAGAARPPRPSDADAVHDAAGGRRRRDHRQDAKTAARARACLHLRRDACDDALAGLPRRHADRRVADPRLARHGTDLHARRAEATGDGGRQAHARPTFPGRPMSTRATCGARCQPAASPTSSSPRATTARLGALKPLLSTCSWPRCAPTFPTSSPRYAGPR